MDKSKLMALQAAMLLGPDGQPIAKQVAEIDDVYFIEIRSPNGTVYSMPWPHKHMTTGGSGLMLPNQRAAALWYFLQSAAHAVEQAPNQVVLEGEEDAHLDMTALAHSISICYDTTVMEMFDDENVRRAKAELERVGGKIDRRIISYIESGGKIYRHYDREPQ